MQSFDPVLVVGVELVEVVVPARQGRVGAIRPAGESVRLGSLELDAHLLMRLFKALQFGYLRASTLTALGESSVATVTPPGTRRGETP